MPEPTTLTPERQALIRELLDVHELGDLEQLARWEGDDLDELAELLSSEEFQTLLDHLADADAESAQR